MPVFGAEEARRLGSDVVGGKAHTLAELQIAGFKVPPFFVVPTDAFVDGELDEDTKRLLATALGVMPASRFAVRSSGRTEDGAKESHAGQFLTLLDVMRDDVPAAAARVFASGLNSSVAAYRKARGRGGNEFPSVIIQAMVPATKAGVAFAADPVTGRRDRVVISAIAGLGERLVSGAESGETWLLALPGLEPVRSPPAPAVLSEAEAVSAARLCLRVSERFGVPQDIEWARAAGHAEPWLLQSRPITTRLLAAATPETALLILDNSNIVESYPGLVSPLTFSFAAGAYARVYRAFLELVGVPDHVIRAHAGELANMLSRLDGRMYYNLGNWYRLLSLLPFFSSNRTYMEAMMGVAEPLPDEVLTEMPPCGVWARIRMIAGLARATACLRRTRAAFLSRAARSIPAKPDPDTLAAMPLSSLAAEYRRIEAALLDRWDAPLINDFLCMMAFGLSRRLMARWGGPAGLAIHNDVMIGQGDIVSAEPARLIREAGAVARATPGAEPALAEGNATAIFAVPRLGDLLHAYIERFGDRRIGELKLEQPTLADNPTPLFQAVRAAFKMVSVGPSRGDPEAALR